MCRGLVWGCWTRWDACRLSRLVNMWRNSALVALPLAQENPTKSPTTRLELGQTPTQHCIMYTSLLLLAKEGFQPPTPCCTMTLMSASQVDRTMLHYTILWLLDFKAASRIQENGIINTKGCYWQREIPNPGPWPLLSLVRQHSFCSWVSTPLVEIA